ncbi:TonB-dependent receptor [Cesiribacter sp. SM1]|uniref:SusC/RagA family TonB-linked outer membrane protein n=1 Tax=Cesiribacter sp. SM1 TaxID=2861196 RepID=UPI001CD3B9AC|nr:TonB-dependent receptor [Cesiribacter sp. SM1]
MNRSIPRILQQELPWWVRQVVHQAYSRTVVLTFTLFLALLLGALPLWAQNTTIRGTVTDENGEGLIGAAVRLKEAANVGAVTDLDGNYLLSVPEDYKNGTILISFLGYVQEEVAIGNQSVINVQLYPDLETLGEVVVIGYGTQEKKDVTGSISSVKGDELKSLPVPSISDALQGRSSGVQVVSTGAPGSDATFRIRGTGTINNSNPLLVIDGVPTQSGLNQLNPNDIASIEILKDASAAAIYGSRGANGVVIVTTKRGSSDKGQLTIDVYRGIQQATGTYDMLNAAQFAALHNEMMENNGLEQNPAFADPSSLSEGTKWLDELLQTAPMQSYSVSYSGGGKKSNFYVSGNVFDQEGIVIETGYRRYTLQLNTDTRVFDRLKFGNNLTLNHDIKENGSYSIRNAMAALPTQPIFNADGTYAGPTAQPSWAGDIRNPIGEARLVDNATKGYNLIGSIYGELDILDNLKFRSNAGLQANLWDSRTWSPKYNWQPTPEPESFLFQQSNKSITWLWDNTLTYDTYFNDVHHITALIGTSAQSNRFDFMNASVKGFASDNTQQLGNGTIQPTINGSASEWSLLSFMGRINYAYQDKYLLTATLRRDGSSRFGEGNKWGMFPSGSVAWRISEEDFLEDLQFVNDLKLRAGYGITGNQEIGNYNFASALNTIQYNFNNTIVPAVVPVVMPNPFVQWETVEQMNVGIDASFFKNRLELTLDGYIKNTDDMLVPMAVPVSTGYSDVFVPSINAGKIQNKGIELAVRTVNTTGKLAWNTDFNISYNKNKVISLNDTVPMSTGGIGFNYNLARIQAGRPINEFYGYVTNGLFQTEEEVENYAIQVPGADPYNRTSAGDIRFLDMNNDGVINDEDRTFLGNPNPAFIFGMNNNFTFRGFDLGVFLQGVYGNKIFNANRIWSEGMAVAQNQTLETMNRWTGQGTSNSMPRAVFNDPNKNTRASNRYIEDGSYLRIKNVTFGYTLPTSLIQRAKLSTARVYASAQNLFTFTNYQGIDPEVPVNGIDLNLYPMMRTISVGVNLGF